MNGVLCGLKWCGVMRDVPVVCQERLSVKTLRQGNRSLSRDLNRWNLRSTGAFRRLDYDVRYNDAYGVDDDDDDDDNFSSNRWVFNNLRA
jgi:hypothetical protein